MKSTSTLDGCIKTHSVLRRMCTVASSKKKLTELWPNLATLAAARVARLGQISRVFLGTLVARPVSR